MPEPEEMFGKLTEREILLVVAKDAKYSKDKIDQLVTELAEQRSEHKRKLSRVWRSIGGLTIGFTLLAAYTLKGAPSLIASIIGLIIH